VTDTHDIVQALIHWMELSTTRSMHHWGHYVRETELSMPQFGLLMRLYHHGISGVTDIGRHSGVSNAAASQLVGRLVEKQLVERTEDPLDRRSKALSLTAKGRQLVETSIGERYRWVADLVAGLTPEERENVSRALPAMVRRLKEIDAVEEMDFPLPSLKDRP
jgi:DNA-binding MarR family transcriptional regulator